MIAAIITGVIGGMPLVDIKTDETTVTGLVTAIKDGFGNTLKSTGIIIGLGVMMGGILEKSGAAEKMAYSFIKAVGKKKEEWTAVYSREKKLEELRRKRMESASLASSQKKKEDKRGNGH